MSDFTVLLRLARMTAGAMTLEQIEQITGGTTYPSHTPHNGTEWSLRVGARDYNLRRIRPTAHEFTIDDPDLAEMADWMDEQDTRLAAMRGVL